MRFTITDSIIFGSKSFFKIQYFSIFYKLYNNLLIYFFFENLHYFRFYTTLYSRDIEECAFPVEYLLRDNAMMRSYTSKGGQKRKVATLYVDRSIPVRK